MSNANTLISLYMFSCFQKIWRTSKTNPVWKRYGSYKKTKTFTKVKKSNVSGHLDANLKTRFLGVLHLEKLIIFCFWNLWIRLYHSLIWKIIRRLELGMQIEEGFRAFWEYDITRPHHACMEEWKISQYFLLIPDPCLLSPCLTSPFA